MAKPKPRPRVRNAQTRSPKVPLTYYRSNEPLTNPDSPFQKKQPPVVGKIQHFFGRLFNGIFILLVLAALVYSLLINSHAKISLNSEVYHSSSTYQAAAQKYVGSLKNRNKITFNEQSIVDSMQRQFPEVGSASVELPVLAETPIVHLNIAAPSLILNNSGNSYVVDSQGVAVGNTKDFSNIKNLPIVDDQSGFVARTGKPVMSSDSVQFIKALIAQLKHANVAVGQIVLPAQAQELDIHAADKPYLVKFDLSGDVLQQTGQFLAARHQFNNTNTQPSQYLDVRVPGKVFYK